VASATWVGQWLSARSDQGSATAGQSITQTRPGLDPSVPLVDVPAAADLGPIDDQIAIWSAKAAANDDDYISATNLGVLYLGRARLTGDLADYGRADEAVRRALLADPGYQPARALDGVVRYATHDFAGAVASAGELLADEPGLVDALTVFADASLELGRVEQARGAYDRLAAMVPGPALDTRLARLAYLTGNRARSLELARGARDAALRQRTTEPAFYHYQLGEFARLTGDGGLARESFLAALAARPGDRGSLLGLARVDAADGRRDEAIAGLRRAAAIAPEPATVALLGDLLALDGDQAAADREYDTVRLSVKLDALAGSVFDRQLMLFELDHGGSAAEVLEGAVASLATRTDAAGHDVVAWALHRLGREDEARAAIENARATGIHDARILFHAGAISVAMGDYAVGRSLLEEALDLGPALDPIEREEALQLLRRAGG
jgi:tetratricopeptide (TPR) repeat protein